MVKSIIFNLDFTLTACIVNERDGLETIIIYVGQGLCKDMDLHRHVCIVFWPNPPIAILELPNCLSYGRLTFLKRYYWLVGQEYNKHVTMKDPISA